MQQGTPKALCFWLIEDVANMDMGLWSALREQGLLAPTIQLHARVLHETCPKPVTVIADAAAVPQQTRRLHSAATDNHVARFHHQGLPLLIGTDQFCRPATLHSDLADRRA